MTERIAYSILDICRKLVALPRYAKRLIVISGDLLLLSAVAILCFWLRLFTFKDLTPTLTAAILVAPLLSVATFTYLGLYRLVTRFIGVRGIGHIAGGMVISTLAWAMVILMTNQVAVPRSILPFYALFGTVAVVGSRYLAGFMLTRSGIKIPTTEALEIEPKNVLIYGAGDAGVRLLQAIRGVADRRAVGFVDREASLWGQYIGGIKVYRPDKILSLIQARKISEVLLALPASSRQEKRDILEALRGQPVTVKVLPALEDIARGSVSVSDLKPIDVDDLLGREPVPPDAGLMARCISGRSILVTGAGGSIGSELVRQILRLRPERLVLFDVSEYALYEIEIQVREIVGALAKEGGRAPEIAVVLGSVLDEALVRETISRNAVDTIFHAAAYKHVPIVEVNPFIGIENNTFGTAIVAKCAAAAGVERFVLISTDKAVRPTNVMGASKRLAEMVLQAFASEPGCRTIFTMVRFGNVLDSSGSVVGLFRRQIKAGGPVTVTHPEITRYFMSIAEAAGLVIQAGAMARGGEVFVLEMGEPVRIDDLARLMVRLTGLEVCSKEQPDGDIEIVYSGLRPGEKLYEELLIGANTEATEHPRIMRSEEPYLGIQDLAKEFEVLKAAITERDHDTLEALLLRAVEGYRPDPQGTRHRPSSPAIAAPSRMLH